MPKIDTFLKIMHESGASDLHLSAECAPMLRTNGILEKTKHRALSEQEVQVLLYEILSDTQIEAFEKLGELDCAYTLADVARFRINIYRKHPGMAASFRIIPNEIPSLDELGHPDILKTMLANRSGLILVTGPANSGKSTTLAAMTDHLNEHTNNHIITLEDPLEFLHSNKNCLINQRQIGTHSKSFANALRAALREDPNVILVGEMRDIETISLAVTAAEIGLLVLGTLHTSSAAQTISRIVDAFPVDQQPQIRLTLSEVIVGVVSQQLIRRMDGKGRVAALEILVGNHAVAHLIREGKSHQVNNVIMTGKKEGMQLMDSHLKELIDRRVVSPEEAARFATEPETILAYGDAATRTKPVPTG